MDDFLSLVEQFDSFYSPTAAEQEEPTQTDQRSDAMSRRSGYSQQRDDLLPIYQEDNGNEQESMIEWERMLVSSPENEALTREVFEAQEMYGQMIDSGQLTPQQAASMFEADLKKWTDGKFKGARNQPAPVKEDLHQDARDILNGGM